MNTALVMDASAPWPTFCTACHRHPMRHGDQRDGHRAQDQRDLQRPVEGIQAEQQQRTGD
ncbi:hypothetical protein [Streptomyces sp. NPDC050988]|uniref:hypothetical protein n=1 Tax=Streptomyces sp. NPDC050988 TaxID=3365637 RepID=UPI0037BA3D43